MTDTAEDLLETAYAEFLAKRSSGTTHPYSQTDRSQECDANEGWDDETDESGQLPSSVDQFISERNLGYQMLLKMGWSKGNGLGSNQQGRVEPVPFEHKQDFLGVGKKSQEDATHVESTAQRKMMDSERMATETETEKRKREEDAHRTTTIQAAVQQSLSAFYCDLCDKQYTKISEMNAHLDSYDHNHRKRFKQMKVATRKTSANVARDKEKAREQKELTRMQEAARKTASEKTGTVSVLSSTAAKVGGSGWKASTTSLGCSGWKSMDGQKDTSPEDGIKGGWTKKQGWNSVASDNKLNETTQNKTLEPVSPKIEKDFSPIRFVTSSSLAGSVQPLKEDKESKTISKTTFQLGKKTGGFKFSIGGGSK